MEAHVERNWKSEVGIVDAFDIPNLQTIAEMLDDVVSEDVQSPPVLETHGVGGVSPSVKGGRS